MIPHGLQGEAVWETRCKVGSEDEDKRDEAMNKEKEFIKHNVIIKQKCERGSMHICKEFRGSRLGSILSDVKF